MKVWVKLPISMHEQVNLIAAAEGVTPEDYILCALAEAVGREEALRKAEKKFEKAYKKAKKRVYRAEKKTRVS